MLGKATYAKDFKALRNGNRKISSKLDRHTKEVVAAASILRRPGSATDIADELRH